MTWRAAFLSPRCLVMAALGFAAGLPYTVVTETSGALLAELRIDRTSIGLLGAVGSVYAFKFLWSPLVDSRAIPFLRGRRRPWLLLTQGAIVPLIVACAFTAPSSASASLAAFVWPLFLMACLSATQELVTTGWTVDAFRGREIGLGSSLYVAGYRVALVAAGTAALAIADRWGWTAAFVAMAALMAIGPIVALVAREPHREAATEPGSVLETFIAPLSELLRRLGPAAIVVFAFTLVFRLPDQLGMQMQKPFLLDTLGFNLTQYGVVRNGIGLAATIVGSLVGGALAVRFGMMRALVIAGILQALSNLGFAWMAEAIPPLDKTVQPWLSAPVLSLVVVSSVESGCGGLVAAAFVAWLMSLCSPRFGASQYALLTAGFSLAAAIASAVSGYLAQEWTPFFVMTAVAAVPGLLLLPFAVRVARPSAAEA